MTSRRDQDQDLSDRVVLITGASSGIGASTAKLLAQRFPPRALALGYNRNEQGIRSTISAIQSHIPQNAAQQKQHAQMQVEAFQADLCDEKQTVELYERVKKRFGRVDCVFINHGINGGKHLGPLGDMDDVSVEDFKSTWQANTLSPFVLTKCCIKEMASRGYGRIIYCSSVAALTGGVIGPHYSSSKSALHGMMRWAANRYAKEGVTVNAVAPALIDGTGMINTDEKPEMKDALQKNIPIGRLGTVEEVADVVLLLLTNSYITSKCWSLDGGWVHQ